MLLDSSQLTIVTLPRGFAGDVDRRQRNAIGSWKRVFPEADILLVGDDPGVEQAARELSVGHDPRVSRTEYGTPLVSDVFARAHEWSERPILMYTNADIVYLDDMPRAIRAVAAWRRRFLLVGRRWNLDVASAFDFDGPWQDVLARRAREDGTLSGPWWMDYFVFNRGMGLDMPPFAVGRPAWDNWLLFHARQSSYPVVDATPDVTVIHQNHDYAHVPRATGDHWRGPESDRNVALAGGPLCAYCLDDASHVLAGGVVRRRLTLQPVRRWLDRIAASGEIGRRTVGWLRRAARVRTAAR